MIELLKLLNVAFYLVVSGLLGAAQAVLWILRGGWRDD